MAKLTITAFTGEQPLLLPELLPDTAAQDAVDLRLNDGGLTPLRQPKKVATAGSIAHKTFLKFDGSWLSFAGTVNAAPGPVAQDRLYYTGDGVPKLRVAGNVYPLALSPPGSALTAAVTGSGTGNVATRLYVYTWVTDFGEESEPSPASAEVNWQSGQTVTLSGFAATPAGRNITKQRIYRSQTGRVGTYLYFIAERAASTSDYVDNVAVDAFDEPLPSADWNAPPDGLTGLISMPNGMMAAFVGRDLYFSEPWRPHAWPEKYVLTTDYPIVALGSVGSALIVLTDGQPYIVTGSHPASMRMDKIEQNTPCINARAVVDLGYAIAFPSVDGLFIITSDGQVRNVTGNLFDRDKWLALSPATAIGAQIGGRYVFLYDTIDASGRILAGALFIDVSGTPFLIRSSAHASAAWFDLTESKLYFLEAGTTDIYELDPPDGSQARYYWRSKEFVLPAPTNFSVIRVDADQVISPEELQMVQAAIDAIQTANKALIAAGPIAGEMNADVLNAYPVGGDMLTPLPAGDFGAEATVYADGKLVANISRLNTAVRLPSGFLARRWEVTVQGRSTVSRITIAHSVADLMHAP